MTRNDRLTDARDLGVDPDDAVALVDCTASWQYAAGIFACRLAAAIEDAHWPLPGTDQLIRQHLVDAQTALGRVYRAYRDAAQLNGYDDWLWHEILGPAVRNAVGGREVPPGQAMTE